SRGSGRDPSQGSGLDPDATTLARPTVRARHFATVPLRIPSRTRFAFSDAFGSTSIVRLIVVANFTGGLIVTARPSLTNLSSIGLRSRWAYFVRHCSHAGFDTGTPSIAVTTSPGRIPAVAAMLVGSTRTTSNPALSRWKLTPSRGWCRVSARGRHPALA